MHLLSELFAKLGIKGTSELSYNLLSCLARNISADDKPIEPYWGILKKGFAPEYRETVMNLIEATKKEAMQIGAEKKALNMAINCLQDGLNLETLAKYTGLPLKKLKELEQKIQVKI